MGESVAESRPESPRVASSRRATRSTCNTRRGRPAFRKGPCWPIAICCSTRFTSATCQRFSPADRICIPVPFYHCFGCVLGTLCCAVYGAAMIIPAEHFDPEATLTAIESERATAVYGVPTMYIAQLEHPTFAGRDLKSLRTGVMSGSPCPIELMKRVVDQMGAREITIAYGLTESLPRDHPNADRRSPRVACADGRTSAAGPRSEAGRSGHRPHAWATTNRASFARGGTA